MTTEVAAEDPTAKSGAADEAAPGAEEAPAAEAVEIPKQQSAEVAADSETGEGART
ncbi:gliding motility protein [Streptomyces sp. NPDC016734]|uniref:gliding motility protein n=1 Tax=Streptomyces TaxID=1883 RepID=UPI00378966FC